MLTTATKKKIDTARDILVGKIPVPTSQVEQITLALIYKFMSDMDKKAKDLGETNGFFANGYEKYAWGKLMDKALPARDRVLLYREALEKMALNPHIPQLFRDVFRNASLPFNDPETLKLFLDVIDQFEYDHSEELGNAFEYLLQIMGSQGDAGQFRTPRHIIDFIVEVVEPKKTDKILDPACGTAGFLISAYKHLKAKGLSNDEMKQISENIVGYDISQEMQRLSLVNMYLHHFPNPHIYEYDSLTSEDRWNDDFDVILANPPFMTPKGGIRPHNRFSVPSNRAEVLFVDYIMEHLSTNGKAGVIVPEGIIFQSKNAYKALRKMMVDNDYLWAVVSLPSGIFQPYSGVKTSILFFDKEIAKKNDSILFVKVENDGFDLGAQRRASEADDLPEALNWLKQHKETEVGAGFKKAILSETPKSMVNLVKKELIAKSGDYNLSAEKYRDNVIYTNTRWPIVELGNLIKTISPSNKIQKSEYQVSGKYPIIDQSQNKIAGFTNDSESLVVPRKPLIIFGDHTCVVKYVDFMFAQGADGIKILDTTQELLPKYLYFILKYCPVESDGYTRHFGKLKRYKIPLPSLSVQQEIVEELDRYQKIVDGAKQVIENWKPKIQINLSWESFKLGDVCELSQGFAVNSKTSHALKVDGDMPLLRIKDLIKNTYEQKVDSKLVPKNTIVSEDDLLYTRTGQIGLIFTGRSGVLHNNCFKISFDKSKLLKMYLFNLLQSDAIRNKIISMSTRSAQPDITHGVFKSIEIPVPSLDIQQQIVAEIESEKILVESTKKIISIYQQKAKEKIDLVWGK